MDSLIPEYKKLAEHVGNANFGGLGILNHAKSIKTLAQAVGAQSMLDFGCGRGDAYRSPHKLHHQLGLPRSAVTLYDPVFRPDSRLPTGAFDLVVCSDVVEHLLEDEVDEFVKRLFGYSRKAVWTSFCARPAKKFFPDGVTNLHTCVKPAEWWHDMFARNAPVGIQWVLVETP